MASQDRGQSRSTRDKERAAYLKQHGIERRGGICPICYSPIPNDTFGGTGAAAHLSRCTTPSPKYRLRTK